MQNKFDPSHPTIVTAFLTMIAIAIGTTFYLKPAAHSKASIPTLTEPTDQIALPPATATSDTFYAPILMYHHISDTLPAGPYVIRTKVFENQMAWLKENNYEVITYSQFYEALTTKTLLPEKSVVISFDDNNKNQYQNALPILKKYDYKAIFFIPTAYVDKREGVMTWEMLKTLVGDDMEIGAHSSTHPNLTVIPKAQLYDEELIGSKKILEEKLGISVKFFAYPGGAKSQSVMKAVENTGYLSAATTIYDPNHSYTENPYRVPRIYVGNSMENFVDFINGRNLHKSY